MLFFSEFIFKNKKLLFQHRNTKNHNNTLMSKGAMAWPKNMLEAAFMDSTTLVPIVVFNIHPILSVNH